MRYIYIKFQTDGWAILEQRQFWCLYLGLGHQVYVLGSGEQPKLLKSHFIKQNRGNLSSNTVCIGFQAKWWSPVV